MQWEHLTILCVLTIHVCSLQAAEGENQKFEQCADLSNTTLLQNQKHREELQVQYLLLTRNNADCPQAFNQDSLNNIEQTYFNISRPTKIVIHGFRATGSKPTSAKNLAQALVRAQDLNVLLVDWVCEASFAYNRVVDNYKEVALKISILINKLQERGCKLESFHLFGISLGAHVAGFIGTLFMGKIGRITALDPAGPLFKGADTFDRLDPSDALFVEAIHADADYFGISISVGHVDFFLNGGKDQPGCVRSHFSSMYKYVICDHMRAVYVYMSALNNSCPIIGIPCPSYEDFLNGNCLDCNASGGNCPTIGLSEDSRINAPLIQKEQNLFLLTSAFSPYCVHHILLELMVSPLSRSAELEVTLQTENLETKQRLRLQTRMTAYKKVLALSATLCEISSIIVKNTGAFYRQRDVHIQSVCLSEFPSSRPKGALCVNDFSVSRGALWSHDYVQVCDL